MKENKIIYVKQLINSTICVSVEDAVLLYNNIFKEITNQNNIILDFTGITQIIPIFINAVIGQLYKDFTDKEIDKYLTIDNLNLSDIELVTVVRDNAKKYYKNPKNHDMAWKKYCD